MTGKSYLHYQTRSMKFVLQLKHWQLFLLLFALPFILYLCFFAVVFTNVGRNAAGEDTIPSLISTGSVIGIAYLTVIVVGASWFFNVATGLHRRLPEGVHMKIKRFYFAFFFPMFYALCILIGLTLFVGFTLTQPAASTAAAPPPTTFFVVIGIIFPLHILTVACIFYNFYFVAKCLRAVELKRTPQIGEYVADFVLLWFYFIGVWLIQPRINEIFSEKSATSDTSGSQYLK